MRFHYSRIGFVICFYCVYTTLQGPVTRTKDGNEVRTVKVADRTGTINLSVWNENSSLIAPCDIFQLVQGNTTVRGGCLTLNVGRYGQLMKIGEFCFPFVESPDFSAYNDEWLGKAGDSSLTNRCETTSK
ncbi:SOSS complex subunit B1 [Schistosoma japonicum]|uniref:SOSS complex subunit B1 n=1 Tax=Schistosoma japonicum TaxID=6182 RepID=A0A4Z2CPM1_SCHJA|nr:SOSS complex subunit B1 [Schistosoma japonicum]TNN06201.1 SOSS complex subunit B1 [Schistosoma japonicum]